MQIFLISLAVVLALLLGFSLGLGYAYLTGGTLPKRSLRASVRALYGSRATITSPTARETRRRVLDALTGKE